MLDFRPIARRQASILLSFHIASPQRFAHYFGFFGHKLLSLILWIAAAPVHDLNPALPPTICRLHPCISDLILQLGNCFKLQIRFSFTIGVAAEPGRGVLGTCSPAHSISTLNWAFDPDGAINKHIQGLYKRFIDTGCINKLFSENDGWKVRSQHI